MLCIMTFFFVGMTGLEPATTRPPDVHKIKATDLYMSGLQMYQTALVNG